MSTTRDSLPRKFVDNVCSTFGAAGEKLLRDLPRLVAESKARWRLDLFEPFPNLSFNFVVPGRMTDGAEIVLKIGVPENKELLSEMAALRLFDGQGMVRLLDALPEQGVFLLERLLPGVSLTQEMDDSVATLIAAQTMHKLQRPAPQQHSFPSVANWFEGLRRLRKRFGGGSGPFPEQLVSRAEFLSAELLSSGPSEIVLHGDLHHDNILSSHQMGWVAIDPKGVVGEPCYEVGAFMRNQIDLYTNPAAAVATIERRFKIFSEVLGYDKERMAAWSFAQAVLSGYWCFEDSGSGWEPSILCAEMMARLIKK